MKTYSLKLLLWKMKNFKILAIFDNFLKIFGAVNQNSIPKSFFGLLISTYPENLKALVQELEEEFQFNRFWR